MTSSSTQTPGSRFVSVDQRVWERRWWGWKFLGNFSCEKDYEYPYTTINHIEDIVDGVKK